MNKKYNYAPKLYIHTVYLSAQLSFLFLLFHFNQWQKHQGIKQGLNLSYFPSFMQDFMQHPTQLLDTFVSSLTILGFILSISYTYFHNHINLHITEQQIFWTLFNIRIKKSFYLDKIAQHELICLPPQDINSIHIFRLKTPDDEYDIPLHQFTSQSQKEIIGTLNQVL